jgi:hypothetical protein
MSYECSDEDVGITFITHLLIHMHQKKKILANILSEHHQVSHTEVSD